MYWNGVMKVVDGDRASKGSSGSCDSLGPTLMYARTVWQRCVISVCVPLLGCSPSHTHFSTLFRAGGEKLRKVRIAQRESVVFLCTHCTCAYTTIHSTLYMECRTLCTRNCFILRYTSCPWRCRKGCLIFSSQTVSFSVSFLCPFGSYWISKWNPFDGKRSFDICDTRG